MNTSTDKHESERYLNTTIAGEPTGCGGSEFNWEGSKVMLT